MKKKVLVLTRYYLPSMKGGGPIQSIKNLVDNLSDKIEFFIVAGDRDLGDEEPFKNIKIKEWTKLKKENIYYINPSELSFKKLELILESNNYDAVYINSFFDYRFGIQAVILKKVKNHKIRNIVIAPRGQFSPGAMNLKLIKKQAFILLSKVFKLFDSITWHATSSEEKEYIHDKFGSDIKVLTANNLTQNYSELIYNKTIIKETGELKVLFISRIHPKKNLAQAINFLKKVSGNVEFNIYGPIEDKIYWNKCKKNIDSLPSNIAVKYNGLISHEEVMSVFNNNHIFLFPTLGENFGHVISEALIGGCPVITSDQTPWRHLSESGVGWDLNLSNENEFVDVIQKCVDLNQKEYRIFSEKAFEYGRSKSNRQEDIAKSYELFS
ncbi:glycosyltransferase [Gudongella sp. DL1XJH-153]|uniref:glycosyltransferase n=1 Tax=Gudongella sp. DL1XJH-153 TaxID=3409804 RepID=UPI003BB4CEE9